MVALDTVCCRKRAGSARRSAFLTYKGACRGKGGGWADCIAVLLVEVYLGGEGSRGEAGEADTAIGG